MYTSQIETHNERERNKMASYMHIETGSVDSRSGWIKSIGHYDYEATGLKSKKSIFNAYIESECLIHVKKVNKNWVTVE